MERIRMGCKGVSQKDRDAAVKAVILSITLVAQDVRLYVGAIVTC